MIDPVSAAITGGFGLASALGSTALAHLLREDPETPEPPRPPVVIPDAGGDVGLPAISMASSPSVALPEMRKGLELPHGYTTAPVPQMAVSQGVSRGYERLLAALG